jgi:2-amino-4-hydroxy-6-hydroxymethyldihydropteridine diphosphokinase
MDPADSFPEVSATWLPDKGSVLAGIALGSNLGDRGRHIRLGFDFLRSLSHSGHFLTSPVYLTEPVDCPPGSPPFLNAVAEIATNLSAEELLSQLQAYELFLGRPEVRPVNSPRPLDLDILYYGTETIRTSTLTVPHPRIAERLFVLEPLAAIRSDLRLPGEIATVGELREALIRDTPYEQRPQVQGIETGD